MYATIGTIKNNIRKYITYNIYEQVLTYNILVRFRLIYQNSKGCDFLSSNL